MILVGEPHPEFPVHDLIRSLDLEDYVRVLGFTPIEHFTGYMSACDIILNLRYPTVGESSGSMLRALGLGKAVLVSDIGSFREFPDSVCLKVPVGAGEEDLIFEYLNLLVSRPELARTLGESAQGLGRAANATGRTSPSSVREFHRGRATAARTVVGIRLATRRISLPSLHDAAAAAAAEARPIHKIPFKPRDIERWAEDEDAGGYIEGHKTRLLKTLELIPPGGPDDAILEMGIYFQITPSLKGKLGYGHVAAATTAKPGRVENKKVRLRRRRGIRVPRRLFRRRERPLSLRRRELLDRALLRADRASLRGSDVHDERDQPHPETRRTSGPDHAQHRQHAGPLGDSQRLSPRLLSQLHQARRRAQRSSAPQSRIHDRRYSSPAGRLPASTSSAWKPANFATTRIPTGPTSATSSPNTIFPKSTAATASTRSAERPVR